MDIQPLRDMLKDMMVLQVEAEQIRDQQARNNPDIKAGLELPDFSKWESPARYAAKYWAYIDENYVALYQAYSFPTIELVRVMEHFLYRRNTLFVMNDIALGIGRIQLLIAKLLMKQIYDVNKPEDKPQEITIKEEFSKSLLEQVQHSPVDEKPKMRQLEMFG